MSLDTVVSLRRDAAMIFDAAVRAVDPQILVHRSLPALLPDGAHRVRVIAAGKAAIPMATAARSIIGQDALSCIVIAPHHEVDAADLPGATLIGAGHPLPDAGSILASRAVIDLLSAPEQADTLLVLLSGGASALLCAPAGRISLDDYRTLTLLLLGCGATIDEINCVRRHTDVLKGGGMARLAEGMAIVALVISDVVGNNPAHIASGPLSGDASEFTDALAVLEKYSLVGSVPGTVLQHLENGIAGIAPGPLAADAQALRNVRVEVIADNATARDAAASYALGLGYTVEYRAEPLTGEARVAGASLAEWLCRTVHGPPATVGSCLVCGGETTVSLDHHGSPGGRNQELALAAAFAIDGASDCVLLSGGTDGVDGSTAAAGGIVDGGTVSRIRSAGIDPGAALRDHDSNRALHAAGDLLITGPTGTNVMDIQVALKRSPGHTPA